MFFQSTVRWGGTSKLKPVAFPDPAGISVDVHGIRCLSLEKIIDLKLASGMSSPGRLRDLADVQELIRHLGLHVDTADRLDASVRDKFVELWKSVHEDRNER